VVDETDGTCKVQVKNENYVENFLNENPEERDHFGNSSAGDSMLLKWIFMDVEYEDMD
jgi:hypothetical protein